MNCPNGLWDILRSLSDESSIPVTQKHANALYIPHRQVDLFVSVKVTRKNLACGNRETLADGELSSSVAQKHCDIAAP